MGWSRPDEDFRADHERDEAKHHPRMGDNKGLELLAAVEGCLAVPQFSQQMPLTASLFREVTERFRRQNGMEPADAQA